MSFNYNSGESSNFNALGVIGSREIANLNYAICIRKEHSNCAIVYERPSSDRYAFTVSGDVLSIDPVILGTVTVQEQNCLTDYIQIPTPFQKVNGVWTSLATNRFCGLGFGSTLSMIKYKKSQFFFKI